MKPMLAAAVSLAVLSAPVFGATQDRDAGWLRQPTNEEVASVRPMAAIREGLDGRVTLKCRVTLQGALTACSVVSEKPEGKGFGAAALTLTSRFQMRPALKDGKPIESWVQFPINMSGEGGRPTDSFIKGHTTAGTIRVVASAPWIKMPTFEDMAAAYPAKAREAGQTGRATVHCRFSKEGLLTGCRTSQEQPVGMGFGTAARQLAANFQAPETMQGASIANVEIDVPFTFDGDMLKNKRGPMVRPVWISEPTEDVMRAVFPMRAMAANVGKGVVVLGCVIGPEGGLAGCKVEREDPKDLGFAQAALAASSYYRVRRWSEEGVPTVGQAIHLAVGYDLPAPELAALKARRGVPATPANNAN